MSKYLFAKKINVKVSVINIAIINPIKDNFKTIIVINIIKTASASINIEVYKTNFDWLIACKANLYEYDIQDIEFTAIKTKIYVFTINITSLLSLNKATIFLLNISIKTAPIKYNVNASPEEYLGYFTIFSLFEAPLLMLIILKTAEPYTYLNKNNNPIIVFIITYPA